MQNVRPIMSPFVFLSSWDGRFLMNRMMLNVFLVSFKNIRTCCSCCCCCCCCWHCCHHWHCGIQRCVSYSNSPCCDDHSTSIVRVKQLKKNKQIKIPQNGGNLGTTHPATECHSIVWITHLTSLLLLLLWDFIWTLHIAWFEIYSYKNYCFKKCLYPYSDKIVVWTKRVKDKPALNFGIKQVQSTITVSHWEVKQLTTKIPG